MCFGCYWDLVALSSRTMWKDILITFCETVRVISVFHDMPSFSKEFFQFS